MSGECLKLQSCCCWDVRLRLLWRLCLKTAALLVAVSVGGCLLYFTVFNVLSLFYTGSWLVHGLEGWHTAQRETVRVHNVDHSNFSWLGAKTERVENKRDYLPVVIKDYFVKYPNFKELQPTVGDKSKTVGRMTTKVTYDPDKTVSCYQTAFVHCREQSMYSHKDTANPQRLFKVALLRRPTWIPIKTYDFSQCEYKDCHFVGTNVTEQTDIVILYTVGLAEKFSAPKRWHHQLYVASTWESPYHTRASFIGDSASQWNSYYNLTMSYRIDSDIFVPYGQLLFKPKPLRDRPNYYEIAQQKDKAVVWLVSNCATPSRRLEYVREMQKYIKIDVYGRCGLPCRECDRKILSFYKFYLSFENSMCTDYVTEKLFKLYRPNSHIVPVVRGGADYDRHFPNFTFVNTAHFKSPKDLALHLKDLRSDLGQYSQFLELKDMYVSTSFSLQEQGCQLCKFLHTHPSKTQQIDVLKTWMVEGHCHRPSDL